MLYTEMYSRLPLTVYVDSTPEAARRRLEDAFLEMHEVDGIVFRAFPRPDLVRIHADEARWLWGSRRIFSPWIDTNVRFFAAGSGCQVEFTRHRILQAKLLWVLFLIFLIAAPAWIVGSLSMASLAISAFFITMGVVFTYGFGPSMEHNVLQVLTAILAGDYIAADGTLRPESAIQHRRL